MEDKYIEDLVNSRFKQIGYKLQMWEFDLKQKIRESEWDSMALGLRISNGIISNPFYKWGSLDSFMRDFIGKDYSKGYTAKDWQRHFEIENLKNCK